MTKKLSREDAREIKTDRVLYAAQQLYNAGKPVLISKIASKTKMSLTNVRHYVYILVKEKMIVKDKFGHITKVK